MKLAGAIPSWNARVDGALVSAVRAEGSDCILRVLCKPRASRSRVVALNDEQLEVQLAAPPVDGEANEELRFLLSRALGVARGRVLVEKGASSRHKVVRLVGLSIAQVLHACAVADDNKKKAT